MHNRIILLETSTTLCSVALAEDGRIVAERRSDTARSQASLTAPFVKEILDESGIKVSDCDAVCVTSGPGSYTGLRVGVSTAKGLCFGAGIPLLSVTTLETLYFQALPFLPEGCKTVIPMLDARRDEVYTCIYSADSQMLTPVSPVILSPDSFAAEFAAGPVVVIGDAAEKCRNITGADALYIQAYPEAKAMLRPAMRELEHKNFADLAYFEPFYLKDFIATVSKKKLF